ncbi:uncharacterized protein LOC132258464 [Phlebotomus argentipes]|uniref:uncharacterized protein LOC132258464 n=1 Tax=Phlebotomus argentipes TaxID=94469 RepID=UPI0028934EBD|nr:uncharacterized protein LOC132258464 [Phlebotomus argentipes]
MRKPVAYELWLETKIHERILDYTGRVRIVLRALEPANIITINSEELLIENHTLLDHLGNNVKITYMEKYENQGILAFVLEDYLRIGQNYVLDILFSGVLHNSPRGFCYTRIIDEKGETSYIAVSFLHMTNARLAFPCYDEPRFRTPFIIHITHHNSMKAASNMPISSSSSDGYVMTSFQETVLMPVNLVAFAVSKYNTEKVFIQEKNLELGFLVPVHLVNETEFATDFIKFMLNKFEEYIGVGYNLPKLDSLVVSDLMNTGLENWGLMVYDAQNFLYNESHTSTSQKMDIARTICHLLTHNYFGNIVGIAWWNQVWMIEGFAYYFEYYFAHQYLAESPLDEDFVTDMMQRYLVENSYITSSTLSKYVETRREIGETIEFAMLTKAAAVLRMTDHMVGRTTFQKGLQKYIKDMAFQTALPEDFYRSIQKAVTEDKTVPDDMKIEDILRSWVDQPGYPLLTVMRNYQSNEIVVNQQRFLSARDEVDVDRLSWYIPLSMSTAANPDMENTRPWTWLRGGNRELVLRTTENKTWSSDDWVLFNIQQTGYYRVNYDTANWKLLASELHRGAPFAIGLLNRAQLIDDCFNLAYSDIVSFTLALDIIKYVRYEQEYSVWITANRHLTIMNRRLEGPSYALYFGRFLHHLTEEHFEKLDVFENVNGRDSFKNTLLRPIIVDLACLARSAKCLTATRTMVTAEALTGHVLAPMERSSVYYCHGLKNADEVTFRYFWRKLKTLAIEQERTHIANSLGCYHNFKSLYSLLLETADPHQEHAFYTNLERFQILIVTIRNGHVNAVLKFIRENHRNISKTYTFNIRMEQALKEIADYLHENDQQEFVDVLTILHNADHININLVERLKMDMEYHHTWVKENKMKIENWIAEYFQPTSENSAVCHFIYVSLNLIAVEPVAYELWLETKIHERILDYTGRVRIVLRALEPANVITINSEELLIENHTLLDHLGNNVKISYMEEFKAVGIVAFVLDEFLRVGQNYILDIHFLGILHSVAKGFCYSRYVDDQGDISYYATSFLYVTNARLAFPCYDEPRFRTPFIIHITHHNSLGAASNMPVATITNNSDDTVTTSFQESVTMSVNLVAFTVSNFKARKIYIENKNLNISILVPKHLINETDFAMDCITFILNKFEEFHGVGYNLPKLESVVVNDLLQSGLESWGLMVFDTKYLLYNESLTTPSQKMDIAKTICHVLTHNYFGNAIGLSWWNNIWMIEGFAYYYEYYFSNLYLEDFPMTEFFITEVTQRYFVDNSFLLSTSLSKYVEARRDIESTFNFAMLNKASAVIRMCDHFLGRETFRKGLQKYIKDMSFKIAEPEDLYRNIQEAADEDTALPGDIKVENVFRSWVDQPGFPLLTVMRNYQSNEIVVNQQRFLSARDEVDVDRLSWYIPLSMSTAANPDMENTRPWTWLRGGNRELVLRTTENKTWSSDDWVLFNIQQTGYYRVNYDTVNWKLLASELHRGAPFAIGLLNRAQLIDDCFNLAYSDIVSFTLALDIIKYVRYEQEYSVWITANRHLTIMNRRLEGPSYALYFGRFLHHLTEEHFEKLDVFENVDGKDTVRTTFLRPIIVDLACRSGSRRCLIATRIMVTAEALTGHVLAPHEKPSVYYCHGLKNADERTFMFFWRKLKTLTNEQERTHIASSLGCYHDSDQLYSLLLETADINSDVDYYTNLDRFQLFLSAVRNGHVTTILKFLRENYEAIFQLYTFSMRMEHAIKEIVGYLSEETQEEFVNVLNILLEAGYIDSNLVERCIIDMHYHRTWVEENKNTIEQWIGEYFQPVLENTATNNLFYPTVLFISIGQTLSRIF